MAEWKEVEGETTALVVPLPLLNFYFSLQKANSLLPAFSVLNTLVDIAHCNTYVPKLLYGWLSRLLKAISSVIRRVCSVLYTTGAWKPPRMETAQALWTTYPTACWWLLQLYSHTKSQPLWFQYMSTVSHPSTLHHCLLSNAVRLLLGPPKATSSQGSESPFPWASFCRAGASAPSHLNGPVLTLLWFINTLSCTVGPNTGWSTLDVIQQLQVNRGITQTAACGPVLMDLRTLLPSMIVRTWCQLSLSLLTSKIPKLFSAEVPRRQAMPSLF